MEKVKIRFKTPEGKTHVITYPFEYSTSRGGWSVIEGKASYYGTNQMFGGPTDGDIIKVESSKRPFYVLVTWYTQDWHCRKAKGVSLCYCDEIKDIAKRAVGKIENEQIQQYK